MTMVTTILPGIVTWVATGGVLVNRPASRMQYCYHYTKTATALAYILQSGTIRLNSFENVNDPRERKDWDIRPSIALGIQHDPATSERISREASAYLKTHVRMLCCCIDPRTSETDRTRNRVSDRGFAKPSMWHHYGDRHEGVCLVFDREKLHAAVTATTQLSDIVGKPVTYSDDGELPSIGANPFILDLSTATQDEVLGPVDRLWQVNAHQRRWHDHLFFRKLDDWSNEDEYRWVGVADGSDPVDVKFGAALVGLVIGASVPRDAQLQLRAFGTKNRLEAARLDWRNGYPRLDGPQFPS